MRRHFFVANLAKRDHDAAAGYEKYAARVGDGEASE